MSDTAIPFTKPFDLAGLSDRPVELRIEPDKAERERIAHWLGVATLERFSAELCLTRRGPERVLYEARYEADLVQACVVTLDPVPAHLEGAFTRDYRLQPSRAPKLPAGAHEIADIDGDEAELLSNSVLDLATPILEELSLAIDPYPRAAGAAFAAPEDKEPGGESPFAALQALKLKPETAGKSSGPKSKRGRN